MVFVVKLNQIIKESVSIILYLVILVFEEKLTAMVVGKQK